MVKKPKQNNKVLFDLEANRGSIGQLLLSFWGSCAVYNYVENFDEQVKFLTWIFLSSFAER